MASNAPAPQQQQISKPTRVSLSYEEISKLFSLPIAEAASILGVCTSVLKRICRTHGIVRWPYRKLASGKVGDDTKISEREKAKELLELSKIIKQKAFNSSGQSLMSSNFCQGAAKSQQGSSKAGQVSPPGKQNASPNLTHGSQTKVIPSYMDDFKYGFPSSGLSRDSMKWWGASSDTDCVPPKDTSREAQESANEVSRVLTDDDDLDWGADEVETEADGIVTAEPSAQLCSLRRKAVDDGRKLLNGDTSSGQGFSRLNKRQKLLLAQVFGASLPEQVLE